MDEPPFEEICGGCGRPLKSGAAFCGGCGRGRGSTSRPRETTDDRRRRVERSWLEFRFVILLYGLLLGTSALLLIAVKLGAPPFGSMAGAMLVDTAIVIWASMRHRRLLLPHFAQARSAPLVYLGVLAAAPVVLLVVHLYVDGLNAAFGIRAVPFLEEYEGSGLVWAFVLGALWPAVFEELSFRGVMFGLLRKHLSVGEALFISSFAFAILHLSVPSLVTHLPMGLWFCWLRHRSGSLWPPMLAHALHNSGVILGEHFSWLPDVF